MQSPLGMPLNWSPQQFPLLLVLDPAAGAWGPEVYVAAQFWNSLMQSEVFLFIPGVGTELFGDRTLSVVPVRAAPPGRFPYTAYGYDAETGAIGSTAIYLPPDAPAEIRFRTVIHELGHVLGLAHDPRDEYSVMFPYAVFGPFRVTAHDIQAVGEAYFNFKRAP